MGYLSLGEKLDGVWMFNAWFDTLTVNICDNMQMYPRYIFEKDSQKQFVFHWKNNAMCKDLVYCEKGKSPDMNGEMFRWVEVKSENPFQLCQTPNIDFGYTFRFKNYKQFVSTYLFLFKYFIKRNPARFYELA